MKKPKNPQAENLNGISERDNFQTPNYAVDLLVPFIPKETVRVWECAAGLGKISKRLNYFGFDVFSTDLAMGDQYNFLTSTPDFWFDVIITNPPFSIKRKFFDRCRKYEKPFALLIPAEYCIWTNEAVSVYGCEKIIPSRRIDYITPNTLNRIHEGEIFKLLDQTDFPVWLSLKEYKEEHPNSWRAFEEANKNLFRYASIYDAPPELLRKYSSSYYASMWLTWGFDIGQSETFVELSNDKKNDI